MTLKGLITPYQVKKNHCSIKLQIRRNKIIKGGSKKYEGKKNNSFITKHSYGNVDDGLWGSIRHSKLRRFCRRFTGVSFIYEG